MIPPEAMLIRIYVNSNERWHGKPLYRAIVETARTRQLAGASVFGVELGYGVHRRLHDVASEYTSYDIPVVIELVDASERIGAFAGELAGMVGEGLVTTSAVQVVRYAHEGERHGNEAVADVPGGRFGETAAMTIEGEAKRVTVYIGSSDTWGGRNLAVAIVERCRTLGIAGATACRGIMGFGKQSIIHQPHLLAFSTDLPEKVEIVDRPDSIARLLPILEEMIGGGLIVVEDVHVVRCRHDPQATRTPAP